MNYHHTWLPYTVGFNFAILKSAQLSPAQGCQVCILRLRKRFFTPQVFIHQLSFFKDKFWAFNL